MALDFGQFAEFVVGVDSAAVAPVEFSWGGGDTSK